MKGVGSVTIAAFIAEVGDIRRFDLPKQIQKYVGLEVVETVQESIKEEPQSANEEEENSEKSCIR